jgi:hypothetical protein
VEWLPAMAAAALAQAGPSAAQEPAQLYRCEVLHSTSGGTHHGYMLVVDGGRKVDGGVRWEQAAPDAGRFNIRWRLDPGVQVASATVEVDVPIRKWEMGRTSLGLRRPDDIDLGDMILAGPVLHGTAAGGRGVAQMSLRTLLAYAADADRLLWHVQSDRSKKVLGSGGIDLAPLREAVAALPEVQAELSAKQARYRGECELHVEQPEI